MFKALLSMPPVRLLGASIFGLLCFLFWIYFVISPFSLVLFFSDDHAFFKGLYQLLILLTYALALIPMIGFLLSFRVFFLLYGLFFLVGGFLGLMFLRSPIDVNLDQKCEIKNPWHDVYIWQHEETEDAVIYWKKADHLRFQQLSYPRDQWHAAFVQFNPVTKNLEINCQQNYLETINKIEDKES